MLIAGYILSVVIGISLGLIGGGGSILTVPILVYLFGISATLATGYSLFIVGITALTGAVKYHRLGLIKLNKAFLFAIPSLASLVITRRFLLPAIPEVVWSTPGFTITKDILIMTVFAILMVTASVSMIRKGREDKETGKTSPLIIAITGLAIGVLTGFLGAGGGFLIVPALVFFAGLNMKQSVGTSLFIIAFNSLLGFLHDVLNGELIDYTLLLTISACAIAGMMAGIAMSHKIPGNKLKPAFGWFVLLMGIYVLAREAFVSFE